MRGKNSRKTRLRNDNKRRNVDDDVGVGFQVRLKETSFFLSSTIFLRVSRSQRSRTPPSGLERSWRFWKRREEEEREKEEAATKSTSKTSFAGVLI